MRAAATANGSFVVTVFSWRDIEPTPTYFYWDGPDAALRAAAAYGLGVVARLDRPPDWALTPDPVGADPPWQPAAYADFVARAVERYGSRLNGVILLNEPNLALEGNGLMPNAVGYVALLRAGYRAVKEISPQLPVLMAGLAFTLGDGATAVDDLAFLGAVHRAGGGAYFDVLAAHPYGFGRPPQEDPAPERLNFRRLELHRGVMVANGDRAKPVWITEMGWRTRAPAAADRWQVVTREEQVVYSLAAVACGQGKGAWLHRLAFWELNAGLDQYGYGLWPGENRASPTYRAVVERRARRRPPLLFYQNLPFPAPARAADTVVGLGDRGNSTPIGCTSTDPMAMPRTRCPAWSGPASSCWPRPTWAWNWIWSWRRCRWNGPPTG